MRHNPKREQWDRYFLRMAFMTAISHSKDPSTKVGAVLVAAGETHSISLGYNGFPKGASDSKVVWDNREEKLKRVVHAEANALLNVRGKFDTEGSTIYTTLAPCAKCMGLLINAGVSEIVYYGTPWSREPHPEIVEELLPLFKEVRNYTWDGMIETMLKVKI